TKPHMDGIELAQSHSSTAPASNLNAVGFLRACREVVKATDPLVVSGKLTRVTGLVLEAAGLKLAVGNCCKVLLPGGNSVEAEVVGFSEERLFLMPLTDVHGLTPSALVTPLAANPERPLLGAASHPYRRSVDQAKH